MKTLFRVAMNPEASCLDPNKPIGSERHLTDIGVNFKSTRPIWCPPWDPLFQCAFTGWKKIALEKQTNYLAKSGIGTVHAWVVYI